MEADASDNSKVEVNGRGIAPDTINDQNNIPDEHDIATLKAVEASIVGDSELSADADEPTELISKSKPRQRTHRVLHFSDGVVEDFSDDDEYQVDSAPAKIEEPAVDPKTLPWGPWVVHQTVSAGGKVLKVCDYLGESLAHLFGITTPKYEYEIEEYKRTIKEEEENQKKEDLEMGGWREKSNQEAQVTTDPTKGESLTDRDFLRKLLAPFLRPKISCV